MSGWTKVTLGEVFEIGSSKRVLQKQWKNEGVPFYRAREIVKLSQHGYVENDLFISEDHFSDLKAKHGVPCEGDLMVSAVGTLGACYVVQPNDRFYFKDASVLRFHPKQEVCSRFFQYAFQWDGLLKTVKKSEGATVGTLTISRAKTLPLTLPPLEDQRRIVAVLDETFAGLARARANAEANLADARELFSSLVDEVAVRPEWPTLPLKELASADCSLSYGIVQPGDETASGLPIVRPVDLTSRHITLDGLKRISPDRASGYARTQLQGGELLLCVRGTTGTVSIAQPELSGANVTRGIVPIRFNDQMVPLFGYYQVLSGFVQKQIEEKTYGAALMQINIRDVKELQLSCPSIDAQKEAAERLERIGKKHVELLFDSEQKIRDLDDLRQSLLQKAFSGDLS